MIFPSERKITMVDFGKLKEMGAASMWTKRRWAGFLLERRRFEMRVFGERMI